MRGVRGFSGSPVGNAWIGTDLVVGDDHGHGIEGEADEPPFGGEKLKGKKPVARTFFDG